MKNKMVQALGLVASAMPTSRLRVAAYRALLGYEIGRDTQIGLIAVEEFQCGPRVTIGRGSKFLGPMRVSIGEGSSLGRGNLFDCSPVAASPEKAHMRYARRLTVGNHCVIHEQHFFDLYGEICIGNGTWIAGRGSQF